MDCRILQLNRIRTPYNSLLYILWRTWWEKFPGFKETINVWGSRISIAWFDWRPLDECVESPHCPLDTDSYYSPILATLTQARGSDRLLNLSRLQFCHVQNEETMDRTPCTTAQNRELTSTKHLSNFWHRGSRMGKVAHAGWDSTK